MRKFEVVSGFENIKLPERKTKKSAGYDICVLESVDIPPHGQHIFSTGLKACMEDDEVLMIYPRSSLGIKKQLTLSNSVGIIDADYYDNPENEGHIKIVLHNNGDNYAHIEAGERVAQGIFQKYCVTDDDNAEGMRSGGIGSTGNI